MAEGGQFVWNLQQQFNPYVKHKITLIAETKIAETINIQIME